MDNTNYLIITKTSNYISNIKISTLSNAINEIKFRNLALYDSTIVLYNDGNSANSLTKITSVATEGTPSYTDSGLTVVSKSKSITLKAADKIKYTVSSYFSKSADFLLNLRSNIQPKA